MNNKGFAFIQFMFIILIYLILFIPVAFWTDSNLDFWLSYIKKTSIDIPFYVSYIVSVILNGIILAINIILSLLRYAI